MKRRILFIGFVLMQFVVLNVKGQIVFTKNDTLNIQNDSLVLRIDNYRGNVVWQYSEALDEWIDLPNETKDSLIFGSIVSSGYFRAKVVDGTCEPVFSDTTYVLRALTDSIINAILSESTNIENKVALFDSKNENSTITIIDTSIVNPMVQIVTTDLPDTIQPGWLIIDTSGVGRIFLVTDYTIQKSGDDFITKIIDGVQVGIDFLITDQTLSYSSPANRTKLEWNNSLKLNNSGKLKGDITFNLQQGEKNISVNSTNDLLSLNFSKKELWNFNTGTTTIRFWIESGSISLKPALDFYAEYVPSVVATKLLSSFFTFNPFLRLPEFTTKGSLNDLKLITYNDFDIDLQLKLEASVHGDISDKIKPVKLVEYFYTIPAGPIFITVKTELFARLILEATGEISINPKVEWNNNIVLGVIGHKSGNQFDKEFVASCSDKKSVSSSIEGNYNFTQRLEIVPKIEVYVMGIVGLNAETIPFQEFTFNASLTDSSPLIYDYSFDVGVDASAAFDISAFHWDNITLSIFKKNLEILAKKNVFSAPYTLEYLSGNNQSGNPGQFLSAPVSMKVVDSKGSIMKNYPVFYDVVSGGGSFQSYYSKSDNYGISENNWQLGSSGTQTSKAYLKRANQQIINRSVINFNAAINESSLPAVTTSSITDITQTTATSGGNVTEDGGATVTARGVCWSTSANPTTDNSKTTNGTGTGSFTSNLTGLMANTPYYVRAYATNSTGTTYGNEVTFTTGQTITQPTLTTNAITDITQTTATSGGNITFDGGTTVTARGICWNTTGNPTTDNSKTINGTGTGSFISNLTGLTANTPYYVRAYATNSLGTAYGNEVTFTTGLTITQPTLTTYAITDITQTTATSGGNVTADGGTPVTARGVCWNTTGNPTIDNNKTTNGAGTGSFTSSLTGLTANTPYYMRAYATNSLGTVYGNEVTFTTGQAITQPTLTTNAIADITQTTATSGGNITSDGGAAITARGICWSTSANPTTDNSKTSNGTGIGSFPSNLTGLTANTPYYVRAYATNSLGTAYGNEVTFTTGLTNTQPTLTTTAITDITQTTATGGGNITADGGTTVTVRGICWNTTSNPTIDNSKTENGTGIGSFTSNLTGLTANTTYFVRTFATNSQGTAYGNEVTFTTSAAEGPVYGSFTDSRDGLVYKTVTIGEQVWMAENLAYLPFTTSNDTKSETLPCYYVYDYATYGVLYNWPAAESSCPSGWHLPSNSEWITLENYLIANGYNYDGTTSGDKTAKSLSSTSGWDSRNSWFGNPNYEPEKNNTSGFSALPGGEYGFWISVVWDNGWLAFSDQSYGCWWSSTEYDSKSHIYRIIYCNNSGFNDYKSNNTAGKSVRCIKD